MSRNSIRLRCAKVTHINGIRFLEFLRADFARNPKFDAKVTLTIWRAGQSLRGRPGFVWFMARRFVQVADFLWTRNHVGAILPPQTYSGAGIRLPHAGMGVVLHPTTRIGANATLYHQVTIGVIDDRGAAKLGDDVYIGAGAKILGPIQVADGAKIGANAVVVRSVSPYTTVVGVPAVEVRQKS